FQDTGFYPHPDFIERVVKFYDVSGEEDEFGKQKEPQNCHWHGTQTVTTCAGNGKLSSGYYSGIASQAELILIKVSENNGRIPDKYIEKGLSWVIDNYRELKIDVVNISLGGDRDLKTKNSRVNQLAEELFDLGVTITVAAGNSENSHSIPPASSPSVITVGGFDDENSTDEKDFELYHSDYGETIDGLIKPEILAPAMFVAAPILPDTEEYLAARILAAMSSAPDFELDKMLNEKWCRENLPKAVFNVHDKTKLRALIDGEMRKRRIISPYYQSVDGTSFSAPIVASIVAQMLEANRKLSPIAIKNILVSTAMRLVDQPSIRQGYGIAVAHLAVERSLSEHHTFDQNNFRPPFIKNNEIVFSYHDDSAKSVSLAGNFNDWKTGKNEFKKYDNGIWQVKIPSLPTGHYLYKFVVDGKKWVEDESHGYKEADGYNGFNSVLNIAK
ncbi:MAG: S8 family serine peptidase, partial [Acidobacteria bacterium]|nr:S8 family serine peptidase [Acidobacteriota bacterium]